MSLERDQLAERRLVPKSNDIVTTSAREHVTLRREAERIDTAGMSRDRADQRRFVNLPKGATVISLLADASRLEAGCSAMSRTQSSCRPISALLKPDRISQTRRDLSRLPENNLDCDE